MRLRNFGEKARAEEQTFFWQRAARLIQAGAFFHASFHERADFFKLGGGVDGSEVGIFIQRVADSQRV